MDAVTSQRASALKAWHARTHVPVSGWMGGAQARAPFARTHSHSYHVCDPVLVAPEPPHATPRSNVKDMNAHVVTSHGHKPRVLVQLQLAQPCANVDAPHMLALLKVPQPQRAISSRGNQQLRQAPRQRACQWVEGWLILLFGANVPCSWHLQPAQTQLQHVPRQEVALSLAGPLPLVPPAPLPLPPPPPAPPCPPPPPQRQPQRRLWHLPHQTRP